MLIQLSIDFSPIRTTHDSPIGMVASYLIRRCALIEILIQTDLANDFTCEVNTCLTRRTKRQAERVRAREAWQKAQRAVTQSFLFGKSTVTVPVNVLWDRAARGWGIVVY